MGARSVQELPVRILTDDELISEYDRTFESAVTPQSHNGYRPGGMTAPCAETQQRWGNSFAAATDPRPWSG